MMGKVEQVEIKFTTISVLFHVPKQIQTSLLWNVKHFLNFFCCIFSYLSTVFFIILLLRLQTFNDIKKREYTRATLKETNKSKKKTETT